MIGRQWQLLLGFAAGFSVAQSQTLSPDSRSRFEFERLGVAEGLPTEYVNCITPDRYGFLWFGSMKGLYRYDGMAIKTYTAIPNDSTSLAGRKFTYSLSTNGSDMPAPSCTRPMAAPYGLRRAAAPRKN